ncbi:MAG: glycosyltransferase [Terriglobia bacterium]|jgi:glycosyltransferase involved in cell wall biosynthesis
MAHNPMVSICMPAYNHAPFLPAALDSILAQTFRDFELVVVDDGSTDGSFEILESSARKYPDVMRVLTHPGRQNLGISVTSNVVVKEARGVYFCPHASDDVSYPDRLERQVGFLESHPEIDWVYGTADFIDEQGARFEGQFGHDLSAFPDLAEELVLDNRIAGATVLIRTKCMLEVGQFEPELMYGDWEFFIRLAARCPSAFLPGAVAGYRCHGYNSSLIFPFDASLERRLENLRHSLEAITALRRKADAADVQLGRPRIKGLLDLRRAAFLILLHQRQSASLAAAEVFRSDPSFRGDLKHLAHCLRHFGSLRLALMMIRELGFPPSWLADKDFVSALLRMGLQRVSSRG